MVIYFTDPMRCLRLCWHLLTSSLLLFSRSLLMRMWYFSSKQSLHLSEDPFYGVALSMMPQDKLHSSFFSFKCQMCLLSSVAFFMLLFLKDCLWPYNGFLIVPSVSPTYFFISCPDFIVASYTMPSKQRPSTGQVSFFLQLHVFPATWLLINPLL